MVDHRQKTIPIRLLVGFLKARVTGFWRQSGLGTILAALCYLKRVWIPHVHPIRDPPALSMPLFPKWCRLPRSRSRSSSYEAHPTTTLRPSPHTQTIPLTVNNEPYSGVLDSSPVTLPPLAFFPQSGEERTSTSSPIFVTPYPPTALYTAETTVAGETPSVYLRRPAASSPSMNNPFSNTASPNVTEAVTASPDDIPAVYCIHPESIKRDEQRPIRSKDTTLKVIPSLTLSFEVPFEKFPLAPDWRPQIHPDGQLYFHKNIKNSRRFVTYAYLRDEDTLNEINRFTKFIERVLDNETRQLPKSFEIVLELMPYWNAWGYYMVDHESKCIFWMHDLDVPWALRDEINGIQEISQMKYWIRRSYWEHWDIFPPDRDIPHQVVNDLRAILQYSKIDLFSSSNSTVSWSAEEIQYIIDLLEEIDKERKNTSSEYKQNLNAALGRVLWLQAHERFTNFYGQPGARISTDKSVFGRIHGRRTWLITLLSPLLFGVSQIHLLNLEKTWIDKVISSNRWKRFMEDQKSEWKELILPATVLLGANVSFLAIPLLFPTANNNETQTIAGVSSPSQVCSLLSVLASMGSIIFGQVLSSKLRPIESESVTYASAYLTYHCSERFGLEPLSIMFSFPLAFFMWAAATFLGAILFLCLYAVQSLSQRIITSASWLILIISFVWIIERHWESEGSIKWSFFRNIRRTHIDQVLRGENEDDQLQVEDSSQLTAVTQKGGYLESLWWARRLRNRRKNSGQSMSSQLSYQTDDSGMA